MKNLKKISLIISVLAVLLLPIISLAQVNGATPGSPACATNASNIGDILCKIGSFISLIIPLLVTLGVIYFVWGVITFIIADGEDARKKGRGRIIYGLIGLVIIVGIWGIVSIVVNTFGISQSGSGVVPNYNPNSSTAGGTCPSLSGGNYSLANFFDYGTCVIYNSVIPLIVSLAVVVFLWGVVQYVINSQEEAKREKGKQLMIWGIIGLAVMVGVWGLVKLLGSTFGILNVIPQLP